MGLSHSFPFLCVGDDALEDPKHREWSWIDDSCLGGCLDDAQVERVFLPDGGCCAAARERERGRGDRVVCCRRRLGLHWCFVLLTLLLLVVSAVQGEEEVGHRVVVV